MDKLDFSAISNDQLMTLLRATLEECVDRGDVVQAAARAVALDESEKAQIVREAAEREAGKLRAAERERIAREAAERVRHEAAAAQRAVDELRKGKDAAERLDRERKAAGDAAVQARQEAEVAISKKVATARRQLRWLERFSELVAIPPGDLTLVLFQTNGSRRVLVNQGDSRYSRKHLVDVDAVSKSVSTTRELIRNKPVLLALALEFSIDRKAANIYDAAYSGKSVLETLSVYTNQEAQPCPTN